MPVAIACPKCQTKYKLPDSAMGKQLKCKSCGAVFKTKAPAGMNSANTIANTIEMSDTPKQAPAPSRKELAELGIGDLQTTGDVFAGTSLPPGQMGLGSVVADPGFADFDMAREEVEEEKDSGMNDVLTNPYLTPGGGKQLKKKKGAKKPFVNDTPYNYKSLTLHAILVTVANAINIVITLAAIGFMFFGSVEPPESEEGLMAMLLGVGLILLALVLSSLLSIVFLMIFMYRANANARSLGAEGFANSPWWCVFGWLIPFLNIVQPFNAMSEIARAARKPRGKSWERLSTPGMVTGWWACFLSGGFVSNLAGRLIDNEVIDGLTGQLLGLAGFILSIVAIVMLILVVWDIAKRQSETAEKAGVA
ncbi:MAG: DUF4328 domain-containing protein [Mariniblastus sp.]